MDIVDENGKIYEFYSQLEISSSRCKFYIFHSKENKEAVVAKAFPQKKFLETDVIREVIIQKQAESDFVVPVKGFCSANIFDENYYIIIEPYYYSDLSLCIEEFEYKEKITVIESMLKAVDSIHKKNIIHRDIKLDNFFVTFNGKVQLADFGSAHFESDMIKTVDIEDKGTYSYMAPECWAKVFDTKARDIYALGICFFYIATNQLPFNIERGDEEEYRKLHNDSSIPEITDSCLSWLNSLVKKMTTKSPNKRITIDEAIIIFETLKKKFS